jgi:predicted AAA+ superfamily ATPase
MKSLQEDLERAREKTVFLSLDFEADRQFFTSQETLIRKVQLEIGKERGYVFLDEIQRKEDAGIFLKGLYDMDLPYKFIVSGSGSIELKEKIHESLAGRKRIFELSTLSFQEFVNFKTDYRYEQKLEEFFEIESEKSRALFDEYLHFGGYPRVVLAQTLEEKQQIISEIYQAYLEKDISYLLGAQKEEAFTHLVRLLASQAGNLVNTSELSNTLGISTKTVKQYLWYLEKTFIVNKMAPYYKNIRKELTKSPVYYFVDLGLRNYAAGEFMGLANSSPSLGFLFQNFVFNVLKEKLLSSSFHLHFWRTKDGAEVDFVIDKTQEAIPIEVKYKKLKELGLDRSFKSFLSKYSPKQAYFVNLNLDQEIILGKTKVSFIPFYKLLFTSFD